MGSLKEILEFIDSKGYDEFMEFKYLFTVVSNIQHQKQEKEMKNKLG